MADYEPNRECYCARCRSWGLMAPAVLVTLGVLFLLENLHVRGAGFHRTWPLILIVIGIVKVLQSNAPLEGHTPPVLPGEGPAGPVNPPPQDQSSSGQVKNG